MEPMRDSGWGVPARRLAVALSAASPRADYRAVGFPLQSLTRNAGSRLPFIALLLGCMILSSCDQPAPSVVSQHRPALPMFPFWQVMEKWDTTALGREIDSLTVVLANDSTYAPGYLRRGQLAIAAYRPGNLLADFDTAIQLDSTLAEAYFSRGVMGQLLESHSQPRRGCKDIQKSVSLGFKVPDALPDLWDRCLVPKWDTLTIGALWKFIPFKAYLIDSPYGLNDRSLIKKCLADKNIPIDSVWIDPQHITTADTTTITLGIYFLSGIVKELEVERSGQMREGNWSGRDGTLENDKVTGKATYGLWQ